MTFRSPSEQEREARRSAMQDHYLRVGLPRLKADIQTELDRRGLASFMNRTWWDALRKAVTAELPFPPPFQRQDIRGPREALWESDEVSYWGDWSDESLEPALGIEWLRVVPRYHKHVGKLVAPETIDCSDQFRNLLVRLRLPWREDERGFWIYGYAPADPATLTWDGEKLA